MLRGRALLAAEPLFLRSPRLSALKLSPLSVSEQFAPVKSCEARSHPDRSWNGKDRDEVRANHARTSSAVESERVEDLPAIFAVEGS